MQGDKALMGTHEEDIDLMGGPNFDRLYHKLKVLSMLLPTSVNLGQILKTVILNI